MKFYHTLVFQSRGLKFLTLLIFACLLSCDQDENDPMLKKVKFGFTASDTNSSGRIKGDTEPYSLMISVANETTTIVDDEVIPLAKFGSEYFTVSGIQLQEGIYYVTKFLIFNQAGDVIMASPVEGSEKAYLVNHPLPLQFTVANEEVTEVSIQVVNVIEDVDTPEDFGYGIASFTPDPVTTFKINTYVINHSTQAHLATNIFVQGFDNGEIKLEKTFVSSTTSPLVIELLEEMDHYRIYVEEEGYYEMEYFLKNEQLLRGMTCCVDANDFTIELVDETQFHRIQVSDFFNAGSVGTIQKYYSYLPADGCSSLPWIDFGGYGPKVVQITVTPLVDQEIVDLQPMIAANDNIGNDFFGIFKSQHAEICQTYPTSSVVSTYIYAERGSIGLHLSYTWDRTLQLWTAEQVISHNVPYGSDLFYQSYDLN